MAAAASFRARKLQPPSLQRAAWIPLRQAKGAVVNEAFDEALPSNQGEQLVDSAWQAYPLSTDQGKWLPNDSAKHGSMPHVKICCRSHMAGALDDVRGAKVAGLLGRSRAQSQVAFQPLAWWAKQPRRTHWKSQIIEG